MPFVSEKEINVNINSGQYNDGDVSLTQGRLLVSGPKTSFRPQNEQVVYSYETNAKGKIVKYYIDGKRLSRRAFRIQVANSSALAHSKFGRQPLHEIKSLLSREVSRFLPPEIAEEKPS
ncbi:MAG: hypothetical protein LBB16_03765 [Puniceicoccales bacterium]|jgi:hypothetical protein|nr:hypothetical protein [Puniceicoccales bacterium]